MAATNISETKKKSARCLFGRPDPEQVSRQLNARLDRMYKEDSRKWNFDFSGGVPIVGPGGDYQFESISASDVPHFYHDRTIRSSRKIIRRREYTPVSDTVEAPEELQKQLLLVNEPEQPLLIASTSGHVQSYEKPVTRSSTAKKATEQQEVDTLKQTKLTNYMPIRKRRSETCLVAAASSASSASQSRAVSIDADVPVRKEKRATSIGNNKNKRAPKRPLRFVSSNLPKSSVSDTAVISSPRSPPIKQIATIAAPRRAPRRNTGAGDF